MVVSFSGSVSAMINSLKNNARKRKTIYDKGELLDRPYNKKIILPKNKISESELDHLRKKMKNEHRRQIIRVWVITIIVFVMTIEGIYSYLF